MRLGDAGEARLRGYLFVLRQTLRSFLPRDTAQEAVREIESHLREAIAAADGAPNETAVLQRVLAELGTPAQVARGYSLEMTLDEAAATAGLVPICRALLRLASTTVRGFFAVLGLFAGYAVGISFLAIAVLKPIFPANVGFIVVNGVVRSMGAQFPMPPGGEVRGGYWVIPMGIAAGLAALALTHRLALRFVEWWRQRARWRTDAAAERGE
jgi:uncharacterized membrane protein